MKISEVSKTRLKAKASNKFNQYEDSQIKDKDFLIQTFERTPIPISNALTFVIMNAREKLITRHRLGLCIQKILEENSNKNKVNLATSLRQLAASSGIEYAIIQKISSGKKDPQWSTIISIVDGLSLRIDDFIAFYTKITDEEVADEIEKRKKKRNVKSKTTRNK